MTVVTVSKAGQTEQIDQGALRPLHRQDIDDATSIILERPPSMPENFLRDIAFAGVVSTLMFALVPVLLLALAIPYAVLRLRASEGPEPDPQVGLKVILYYFFSVSMLMILVGFTILAIDAVQEKEEALGPFGQPQRVKPRSEFNEAQRIAVALILTGLLFGLFHWVLAKIVTNDRQYPAARRVFVGWRLAFHGLVLLNVATALMVTLFQKDPSVKAIKTLLAVGFVWAIAWIIDLILLSVYSRTARKTAGQPRRSLRSLDDEN